MATRTLTTEVNGAALYRPSGGGYDADLGGGRAAALGEIRGVDRFKYFRRPLLSGMKGIQPDAVLDRSAVASGGRARSSGIVPSSTDTKARGEEPKTRDAEIQSDYRESEAQTDPFTPQYVIRSSKKAGASLRPASAGGDEGEREEVLDGVGDSGESESARSSRDTLPEVLSLAHLTYGSGLPAGKDEIELIDKIRRRRHIESTLPSIDANDPSSLHRRLRVLEELELLEWAERDREIGVLQEERLRKVAAAYEKRDATQEAQHAEKIHERVSAWKEKLQSRVEALKERRLRHLRKAGISLERTHSELARQQSSRERLSSKSGRSADRRDVISEYASFGSKVYAPPARLGIHPDKTSQHYEAASYFSETLGGLNDLEKAADRKLRLSRVAPLREIAAGRTLPLAGLSATGTAGGRRKGTTRREAELLLHLTLAQEKIDREKSEDKEKEKEMVEKDITDKFRATPRVVRPPTPTLEDDVRDEEEAAVILLQRLLRGRAGQEMMFEGKEKRLDLIKELVEVEKVKVGERSLREEKRAASETAVEETSRVVGNVVDGLAGRVVGDVFDYLAKEKVRRQEERAVAALHARAMRERALREAAESGRRQDEWETQRLENMQFGVVMRDFVETASSLVDEITSRAVLCVARSTATTESHVKEGVVEKQFLAAAEAKENVSSLVRDLVGSFVLPEVASRSQMQSEKLEEQSRMLSIHSAVTRGSIQSATSH